MTRTVQPDTAWILIACWVAAGLTLYFLGPPPTHPAIYHDELCRLGWARFLSGTGPHYEMGTASYCQPTYPLLIAPLYWLTTDSTELYRYIFLINSFLAGACLPLAIRLGIRHFDLNARAAWLTALAILAYPSLTLLSHHAWTETALYPAVLLGLLAWCNWVDRPAWNQFFVLAAISFLLYMIHRKMLVLPLTLITGVAIAYIYNRNERYRLHALLLGLVLAFAFLIEGKLKVSAMLAFWQRGDTPIIERFVNLTSMEYATAFIAQISGYLLYAALVTGGCIWLVLAGGISWGLGYLRSTSVAINPIQKKSLFIALLVILLAAETAIFLNPSQRFDVWFYGRHMDPALAASLLPAFAMILHRHVDRAHVVIVLSLIAGVVIAQLISFPNPSWEDYSQVHLLGAAPVMDWLYQATTRQLLLASCAGILAVSSIVCIATFRSRLRFVALVPFIGLTIATHATTQPLTGVPAEEAFSDSATSALSQSDQCYVTWDRWLRGRETMHQFWRLQYNFPNCQIETNKIELCPKPGQFDITKAPLPECKKAIKLHKMHPNLFLRQMEQPQP